MWLFFFSFRWLICGIAVMFLSEAQKRELEDLRYLKWVTTHPGENSHLATAGAAAQETHCQVCKQEPEGEFQCVAEKQYTGLTLHPLPRGAEPRVSFGSCVRTSHGNASRNGRRNLLGSWEVSELLGGSTLCSCMAVQMNSVVHPAVDLGVHWVCTQEVHLGKAPGMHPGMHWGYTQGTHPPGILPLFLPWLNRCFLI